MGDKNINTAKCEQCTEGDNHGMNKVKHNAQNATGDDNAQSGISNLLVNECNETTSGGDVKHVHYALNKSHTSTEIESKSSVYHEVNIKDQSSMNNRNISNDIADFHSKGKKQTDEDKYDEKDQVRESDKQKENSLFSSSRIQLEGVEDNSEFGGSQLDSNAEEVESVDNSQINTATNIIDAHVTFVDEDDGISRSLGKLFGKACGVDKKKLLDEELEPYSKNPFDMKQENTTYGTSNISEYVGVRLEKTETRTAVSPIRQPETPENHASRRVSKTKTHEPSKRHRCSADVDRYDLSHSERGYMVLIVNDNFVRQTSRDGAICDLRKMQELGKKFGFRGLQYQIKERNLTKPELLDVLLKAQRTDHSDCDCFLLVISTHGLEQENARMGGQFDHALVCADDQLIFTSSIIEMFNDTNCPSLKGKPKIFLIQACRGEKLDHGQPLLVAHPKSEDKTCMGTDPGNPRRRRGSFDDSDTNYDDDSWRMNHQRFQAVQKINAPTPYAIAETTSLKCDNDMLVMYAIPPGMFAWRNTDEGSWMIDFLHQVLMRHDLSQPKNFLNILTQVNALMSRRATNTPSNPVTHNKTAISVIEHKLCKDIVFERKVPLTDWM